MLLGPVGRVLGVPQLPGKVLTVLGHPKVFLGPARGVLGRFKFPGHMQSVLRLVNAADPPSGDSTYCFLGHLHGCLHNACKMSRLTEDWIDHIMT
jgi:hypothetical protein